MKTITEIKKEAIPIYRKRYMIHLNELQLGEYRLLLYGLRSISPENLLKISDERKRTIIYNNDRAWKIINQLKQEKLNKLLSFSLNSVFGTSLCGEGVTFLLDPITDHNFIVSKDLIECNPTQEQIIHAFINNKLLSSNFLK